MHEEFQDYGGGLAGEGRNVALNKRTDLLWL